VAPVQSLDVEERDTVSERGGWHPDPFGRHELRYHNGERWTGDVASRGVRSVDAPVWSSDPHTSHSGHPPSSETRGGGAAVTALVLGIVGVCLAWLPFLVVIGALAAIGALVAARSARSRATSARRATQARVGGILGIVALVLVIPGVLLTRLMLGVLDPGPHTVEITSCKSESGRAVLTGAITNLSDRDRGYLLLVRFSRAGTGSVIADEMMQIDEVAARGSEVFVSSIGTAISDVECDILDVLGGVPFDLR
jgi:hypothetical protein